MTKDNTNKNKTKAKSQDVPPEHVVAIVTRVVATEVMANLEQDDEDGLIDCSLEPGLVGQKIAGRFGATTGLKDNALPKHLQDLCDEVAATLESMQFAGGLTGALHVEGFG